MSAQPKRWTLSEQRHSPGVPGGPRGAHMTGIKRVQP
jgi:hypothetical protein